MILFDCCISEWNTVSDCMNSITVGTVVRRCVPNVPATRWQYQTSVTSVWCVCVMIADCGLMMNSKHLSLLTGSFLLEHQSKEVGVKHRRIQHVLLKMCKVRRLSEFSQVLKSHVFFKFQVMETPWKQTTSVEVLESVLKSPWMCPVCA